MKPLIPKTEQNEAEKLDPDNKRTCFHYCCGKGCGRSQGSVKWARDFKQACHCLTLFFMWPSCDKNALSQATAENFVQKRKPFSSIFYTFWQKCFQIYVFPDKCFSYKISKSNALHPKRREKPWKHATYLKLWKFEIDLKKYRKQGILIDFCSLPSQPLPDFFSLSPFSSIELLYLSPCRPQTLSQLDLFADPTSLERLVRYNSIKK